MLQQINLYKQFTQPKKIFFNLESILVLYGVFLAVLLINTSYTIVVNHHKQNQVTELTMQATKWHRDIEDLKAKHPIIDVNNVNESVRKLQKELLTKGKMLAVLSRQTLFSSYLLGLANAIVPGAWLTEITINDAGQSLILKGNVTQAGAAQQFILSLKKQTIFNGVTFELSDLAKTNDATPYFNFTIIGKTEEL